MSSVDAVTEEENEMFLLVFQYRDGWRNVAILTRNIDISEFDKLGTQAVEVVLKFRALGREMPYPVINPPKVDRERYWTPEEDEVVKEFVKTYGFRNIHRIRDVTRMPRSSWSCIMRWLEYLEPELLEKLNSFTKEEDQLLLNIPWAVEGYEMDWGNYAKSIFLTRREPCILRERWEFLWKEKIFGEKAMYYSLFGSTTFENERVEALENGDIQLCHVTRNSPASSPENPPHSSEVDPSLPSPDETSPPANEIRAATESPPSVTPTLDLESVPIPRYPRPDSPLRAVLNPFSVKEQFSPAVASAINEKTLAFVDIRGLEKPFKIPITQPKVWKSKKKLKKNKKRGKFSRAKEGKVAKQGEILVKQGGKLGKRNAEEGKLGGKEDKQDGKGRKQGKKEGKQGEKEEKPCGKEENEEKVEEGVSLKMKMKIDERKRESGNKDVLVIEGKEGNGKMSSVTHVKVGEKLISGPGGGNPTRVEIAEPADQPISLPEKKVESAEIVSNEKPFVNFSPKMDPKNNEALKSLLQVLSTQISKETILKGILKKQGEKAQELTRSFEGGESKKLEEKIATVPSETPKGKIIKSKRKFSYTNSNLARIVVPELISSDSEEDERTPEGISVGLNQLEDSNDKKWHIPPLRLPRLSPPPEERPLESLENRHRQASKSQDFDESMKDGNLGPENNDIGMSHEDPSSPVMGLVNCSNSELKFQESRPVEDLLKHVNSEMLATLILQAETNKLTSDLFKGQQESKSPSQGLGLTPISVTKQTFSQCSYASGSAPKKMRIKDECRKNGKN